MLAQCERHLEPEEEAVRENCRESQRGACTALVVVTIVGCSNGVIDTCELDGLLPILCAQLGKKAPVSAACATELKKRCSEITFDEFCLLLCKVCYQ